MAPTDRSGRRIVAGELARRFAGGVARQASLSATCPITASIALRDTPPGTQQDRRVARQVEHRRPTPTGHGPPSTISRHALAQRSGDMLGASRADRTATIGRGRPRSAGWRRDQRLRHRMGVARIAYRVETRLSPAAAIVDSTARGSTPSVKHLPARTMLRLPGRAAPTSTQTSRLLGVEHVADQRAEMRQSLAAKIDVATARSLAARRRPVRRPSRSGRRPACRPATAAAATDESAVGGTMVTGRPCCGQ